MTTLTQSFLQVVRAPEKGKKLYWDDDLTNFGVTVFANGAKAFFIDYRQNGRRRRLTLGKYPVLTVAEARAMARKRLVEVLEGDDPAAARQAARKAATVGVFCDHYLKEYAAGKKSYRGDKSRIELYVRKEFGPLKLPALTERDVAQLLRSIGRKHPYQANRVRSLISKMWEFARSEGFVEKTSENPAKGIEPYDEKTRDRFLTESEMSAVLWSIDQEQYEYTKWALKLLIITGLRKEECLALEWRNVDAERGEIRLEDTKAGRPHYLPIPPEALDLLKQIPRRVGNPYVLPGMVKGQPITNINDAWDRIRTRAQVPDVRIHDIRRTLGSWMAQSGQSLHLIGTVLNHSNAATTQIYARFQRENVRSALETHAKHVLSIKPEPPKEEKKKKSAKVVRLRPRK